ncbi:MAG: hypothetical protein LBV43_15530 [Prevotella sp.]|jgi:hypothetical protein|nr:hypothetical protein [Prevotella sp.]
MRTISTILFSFFLLSCNNNERGIKIEWTDNLRGDFSFTEQWDYPEGILLNDFAQLVCDGLCDERTYKMRDEEGKIFNDSIDKYYQLTDTTHLYHTTVGEAQCYEWAGTNFARAYKGENDTILCYTECNAATHSSLELRIIENKCFARIKLNSITDIGEEYFDSKGGYIKIEKQLWKKGILKAEFDIDFIHPDNIGIPMWWNGKIYTKIENYKPI